MRAAVNGLTDAQLDTPYRDGGWTVRQVVHHVADSHMNAYIRMRLALTADMPKVPSYDEAKWAELADARSLPVEVSLSLLDALHLRWTTLMRALTPEQLQAPVRPLREREDAARLGARAVRLARPPSHGADHRAPRGEEMVSGSPAMTRPN